ncbi:hypothetical protein YN1_7250 [Nanoarchaeota archaeon]
MEQKKIITNDDIINISIKEIELTVWLLLYSKDKEKIKRYRQYIIDLIKDIRLKILEIYQNYIIDYVSDEEQKELEEDLKDI